MVWMNQQSHLTTNNNKNIQPNLTSSELKNLIEASYQRNKKANEIGNKSGYHLDESLSNSEHKVFTDDQGNPYVSFTGSRKFSDWLNDGLLAVGLESLSPRFFTSKELMDRVHYKYNNKPTTVVGHSLGGSLAEYSSNKNDKVYTVNKGVGLSGIGKHITNNQTDIRNITDPVSMLSITQSGKHKETIPKTAFINPIEAHKYKYLNRLN